MKYIYFPDLKVLFEEMCDQIKEKGIEFLESKEFKKSDYNNYTARQLLEIINQEDREEKRAALLCFLHYKMNRVKKNTLGLYTSQDERRHYEIFMKG